MDHFARLSWRLYSWFPFLIQLGKIFTNGLPILEIGCSRAFLRMDSAFGPFHPLPVFARPSYVTPASLWVSADIFFITFFALLDLSSTQIAIPLRGVRNPGSDPLGRQKCGKTLGEPNSPFMICKVFHACVVEPHSKVLTPVKHRLKSANKLICVLRQVSAVRYNLSNIFPGLQP